MNEQDKAIYELYEGMYATSAWQQFITDLEDSRTEMTSIEGIKDAKELHVAQGQLTMIDRILNMEHMMGLSREQQEGDV